MFQNMSTEKYKLKGKMQISIIASFLILFISCDNSTRDKAIAKQEAAETKKLLKNYVDLELHTDSIYVDERSTSLFAERCLDNLISKRPEIGLTSDDVINKSHLSTTVWTKDILPYAIILTKKDLQDPRKGRRFEDPIYKKGFYIFTDPVFSRDLKFAFFQATFICGGTCGGDATILLKKVKGVWRVVKKSCEGIF